MRRLTCRITPLAVLATVAFLGACGGGATTTAHVFDPATDKAKPVPAGVRVVAVGDISCAPGQKRTPTECAQAATAKLATRLEPEAAILPGDLQYESAAQDEWPAFDRTWGQVPFDLHPAPGNHEYVTPRAAAYYDYFGARAGKPQRGWYAFNLGGWRIYALNSNCSAVGCTPGTSQEYWLRQDLARNRRTCVMAFWHHPRFSSGLHGDTEWMQPLWQVLQDAHADLVLEGHDHHYERFQRMTADGRLSPEGMASFVVGMGGKSQYPVLRRTRGSRKIVQGRFGVLALTLRQDGWGWSFRTIGGARPDSGTAKCR